MSTVIISNDMNQPYGEFVTDFLHKISEKGVQKIAMVGLADAEHDAIRRWLQYTFCLMRP